MNRKDCELSIIFVNYFCIDMIEKCINSLLPFLNNVNFEIIIIDNSENMQEMQMIIKKKIPYKICFFNKNRGFGNAINKGIKLSTGKYILILNPDLIFKKFEWKKVKEKLKSSTLIGGVLKLPHGGYQINCWFFPSVIGEFLRKIFNRLAERNNRFFNKLWKIIVSQERSVHWITGAIILSTREVFIKLNGFDENFFLFFEDVDLCYRAHKNNIAVKIIPYIEATHFESSTSKSNAKEALKIFRKSRDYFWKKHYSKLSFYFLKISEKISDIFR